MSDIFNYLVYGIYLFGFVIAIYYIIADRQSNSNNHNNKKDDIVKVYVKKKRCVWNNKLQNISYIVDILYNEEEFRINDECLFEEVEEGSYIQMRVIREKSKQGEDILILKKI